MNEWKVIADTAETIQGTKNEVLNPMVSELVETYASGKHLFDYGCGWGEFADMMTEQGFQVVAFDDADEMVAQARQKFTRPTFLTRTEMEGRLGELEGTFDVVVSNLVLCILEKPEQAKLLSVVRALCKEGGTAVISLCHPKYDHLPDSLVSERIVPENVNYEDDFQYEKVIKENGVRFHDYHHPLEYYLKLFEENGYTVLESKESDTLGSEYKPDFIAFALSLR